MESTTKVSGRARDSTVYAHLDGWVVLVLDTIVDISAILAPSKDHRRPILQCLHSRVPSPAGHIQGWVVDPIESLVVTRIKQSDRLSTIPISEWTLSVLLRFLHRDATIRDRLIPANIQPCAVTQNGPTSAERVG